MDLVLKDLLDATGGTLMRGALDQPAPRLAIDSRVVGSEDVFVAFPGERVDGNDFVRAALEKGAAGVVCTRVDDVATLPGSGFVLHVPDALLAMQAIATEWRRRLNVLVIGITGSSGKTTTKELLAHLCTGTLAVLATEGNKNNHIGLPMTLSRLERRHQVAILEMGMNHSGEIALLAKLARPSVGVLTNVGDAHLGNFPSREALIAAKAELFAAMDASGTAILNRDCPATRLILEWDRLPARRHFFGESPESDIRAVGVQPLEPMGYRFNLDFGLRRTEATLRVFGRYQISNALAAATAAHSIGITPEEILERLATFSVPEMRSRVQNIGGLQVVEDCYNASPAAVKASLNSFAALTTTGRRVALLGDMAELGGFAEESHREVGCVAAQPGIAEVVCVGSSARWTADEAKRHGANARHFDNIEAAVEYLARGLATGDSLLVKGSRVARLERAIELLRRSMAHSLVREATA